MTAFERIAAAWMIAAEDLGVTFVTPFDLEEEGKQIRFAGLLRDFGSENGMLIFVSDNFETEPWASTAQKRGFGYSHLSESYGSYDRQEFIAALNDWGWSPKDRPPPAWYTGAPWTS